ncbi:hypothetical protein [Fuchsiella alkaliacetigena]|uniref:hypothetical protein n=1 Tax=Fuchsiella alkaliacetigena TaxID=957042 RepID=UPI002009FF61|nr:hypothetical protein [Fuchsiella alkaliacetigena]MCK8823944.1 hypothetical protein [Fuchsiella alkaliacetigena]
MSRGFYNFILKLIEKIESLLIKGTIVLIILLITVQISFQHPFNEELDLRDSELLQRAASNSIVNRALNYLPFEQLESGQLTEERELEQASQAVVGGQSEIQQGEVTLRVLNLTESGELKVLINEEVREQFSSNSLQFSVEPGDEVALDARGIEQGLWVEVVDASDNIASYKVGEQFWLQNEVKSLFEVEFGERY